MAYLILEDEESGSESAYFEFDPTNETTLDRLERLLASRRHNDTSVVEAISELSGASMERPSVCRKAPWIMRRLRSTINLLSRKPVQHSHGRCRCGNGKNSQAPIQVKSIVLAP